MAQQLRVLVLAIDLFFFPAPILWLTTTYNSSSRGGIRWMPHAGKPAKQISMHTYRHINISPQTHIYIHVHRYTQTYRYVLINNYMLKEVLLIK